MERNVIVYFGMGFLPESNAVACREQAFAKMVLQTGNIPVLIGIKRGMSFREYEKSTFEGVTNYSLKYAGSFQEKIKDNFVVQKTLTDILEEIGLDRIKCFIMQDYQWLPMKQMKKTCEKNGIAFAADIMDWFTPTSDYSLPKNIFKTVDTYMLMHWFYPGLKNKIYISHKFADFFRDKKANIMVLPCTARDVAQYAEIRQNEAVTLTFAGFPGRKFEKEKLDWIIRALSENQSSMILNIIGISLEECLERNADLKQYITENIRFLGRIPHEECLQILKASDFSIIARQVNKLTTYGFSSKICEAFVNGIPVITTANSDNRMYIKNGINGYTCEPTYEGLKELLKNLEAIGFDEIQNMKRNLQAENPLRVAAYYEQFEDFLKQLKLV